MRAGWFFVRTDANGDMIIPASAWYTAPFEIHSITGGPSGNEHTHLLIGGFGVASIDREGEVDENHTHNVILYDGANQIVTTGATNHNHSLKKVGVVLKPKWMLAFTYSEDAIFQQWLDSTDAYLAAEATLTPTKTGYTIDGLDKTTWTAQERTTWETRIEAVLGIHLHPAITNGDRLVAIFCGALVGRPQQTESAARPSKIVVSLPPIQP